MSAPQDAGLMLASHEVWDYLCRNAGLDTDFYDSAFEQDLRKALGLAETGDMHFLLRQASVSTELFLGAFFEAAEPYAQMMSDLLVMFERAAADTADDNVAIEFDFGADLPQLDFDLRSFRQWLERWKRVSTVLTVNIWDIELMWELARVLRPQRDLDQVIRNHPPVARWIHEYELERWPTSMPPPPQSGNPDLDARLNRVWKLWETVVRESSRFGASHEDLELAAGREEQERREADMQREAEMEDPREFPREERDTPNRDTNRRAREDGDRRTADATPWAPWPATILRRLNSDHWTKAILIGTFAQAASITREREPQATAAAHRLAEQLDQVFRLVDTAQRTGTQQLRVLDDFLSLPVWRRRHELFSAWVSTQILDALESQSVRIHQHDGLIEFSFAGTHLATADAPTPRLHLWAEMRSPLASPIGKGRRAGIQPDYSLLADPVTNPLASVLEVECKQYRRPSARNFSAALADYARGRPNATVVLVNYGPVSDTILPRVPDDVRDRTHILGNFRPGEVSQLREFRHIITATLSRRMEQARGVPKRLRPMTVLPEQIILSWGAEPRDLDLHLFIDAQPETCHIWYNSKGNLDEWPWARLSDDVTTGNGPEEIRFRRWVRGTYSCFVHKFSGEVDLANSQAKVQVVFPGGRPRHFCCPRQGTGDWWHVFSLEVNGNLIGAAEIVQTPPHE